MRFQILFLILIILFSYFIFQSGESVEFVDLKDSEAAETQIASVIAIASDLESALNNNRLPTFKTPINNSFQFEKCFNSNLATSSAKTALVKYLNSDFNTYASNGQNRWPIASISKLMTAIIAEENINKESKIVITESAVSAYGENGNFKIGEVFKLGDLIKAMLVISSNDAAEALAESFGREEFVKLMNKKAEELKMTETYFKEPTGLSFANQSTAEDLIKLVSYIYNNHQDFFEITRQKEVDIIELKTNKKRKLTNIDLFAGEDNFLGGKTGYIDESGRNLVALFNKSGKIMITVVLGADDAFIETKNLLNCI